MLPAFAGVLTAFALDGQARGGLLPTVSLPTLSLPSLPSVTTPTVPSLPKPPAPPSVTVPAALPTVASVTPAAAAPSASQPASRRHRGSTHHPSRPRRPTVSFRLRSPGKVVFTAYGPSPSCGVAATKTVQGRRGMNRIPVSRHFGRRSLKPGTYRIDVVAEHGKRLGRTAVRVPRSGRARRAAAPVLHCAPPVTAVAAVQASHPRSAPPTPKARPVTHRLGFRPPHLPLPRLPLPALPIGDGSGGWISLLQIVLLTAILAITGAVLAYVVRFYRRLENP
ncbi:MAG: hypothetical protein ACXVRE_05940 [Gaiellaceae bacterium]